MTPTSEQAAAIAPHQGTTVVVAAAGTGKTRTMVMRILSDIVEREISPSDIVAITFTVAGARELRDRLRKHGVKLAYCGTLHGYVMATMPSVRDATLITDEEMTEVIKEAMAQQMIRGVSLEAVKAALEAPEDPPGNVGLAVRSVRHAVRSARKISFGMMLRDAYVHGGSDFFRRLQVLIVDEAQDTAPIDAAIYDKFEAHEKVFVGDPRQAIYAFRGCTPRFFARLARRPETVSHGLTMTFRCSPKICEAANRLFPNDAPMVSGATGEDDGVTVIGFQNEHHEHAAICAFAKESRHHSDTVAVITRYNDTVNRIAQYLSAEGVRVRVKLAEEERRLTVAALRALIENTEEAVEAYKKELGARAAKMPELTTWVDAVRSSRVIGETAELRHALMKLAVSPNAASAVTTLSMTLEDAGDALEAAIAGEFIDSEDDGPPAVVVSTIHGVKGREFDRVVVARNVDHGDDPEECRLQYVAITRARKQVIITVPEI